MGNGACFESVCQEKELPLTASVPTILGSEQCPFRCSTYWLSSPVLHALASPPSPFLLIHAATMSHVEAAASLFGTSDTSQDFFSITDSASGDNTAVDTNTSSSATGSLNSDGVFDSNNSSELFGASDLGPETSNLFSNDTVSDFLGNDAVVAHSTPPEGNSYGSDNQYSSQGSVSYDSSNNANSGTMDTHSQSWDSGYGQWSSTAPQNSYGEKCTLYTLCSVYPNNVLWVL